MRAYSATRYVVPLREGGSLPAVIDTDGGGLFVVKFRGAGQGAKALLAEILVAEIARHLDLPVPETALIELDAAFGRTEPDPEIQDILKGSRGINFGMRYLDGAFNFDPVSDEVPPDLAADIVWLDALVTNIDRTAKNPNLMWHGESLQLIDHGAAAYFHHNWPAVDAETATKPFAPIADHVLLPFASKLQGADERLSGRLTDETLESAVNALPDDLLMDAPEGVTPPFTSPRDNRAAYARYFAARLSPPRAFVKTAVSAQAAYQPGARKDYRR